VCEKNVTMNGVTMKKLVMLLLLLIPSAFALPVDDAMERVKNEFPDLPDEAFSKLPVYEGGGVWYEYVTGLPLVIAPDQAQAFVVELFPGSIDASPKYVVLVPDEGGLLKFFAMWPPQDEAGNLLPRRMSDGRIVPDVRSGNSLVTGSQVMSTEDLFESRSESGCSMVCEDPDKRADRSGSVPPLTVIVQGFDHNFAFRNFIEDNVANAEGDIVVVYGFFLTGPPQIPDGVRLIRVWLNETIDVVRDVILQARLCCSDRLNLILGVHGSDNEFLDNLELTEEGAELYRIIADELVPFMRQRLDDVSQSRYAAILLDIMVELVDSIFVNDGELHRRKPAVLIQYLSQLEEAGLFNLEGDLPDGSVGTLLREMIEGWREREGDAKWRYVLDSFEGTFFHAEIRQGWIGVGPMGRSFSDSDLNEVLSLIGSCHKRVVLNSCYSGAAQDVLSGAGTTIITTAPSDAVGYALPPPLTYMSLYRACYALAQDIQQRTNYPPGTGTSEAAQQERSEACMRSVLSCSESAIEQVNPYLSEEERNLLEDCEDEMIEELGQNIDVRSRGRCECCEAGELERMVPREPRAGRAIAQPEPGQPMNALLVGILAVILCVAGVVWFVVRE